MASQAEIDLLVDATNALPTLQRDLARIVSTAERNADDIDLNAAVNTRDSLDAMQRDLARVIRAAENGAPDLDLVALLDQQRTLTGLRRELNTVITQVGNQAPDIDVSALLNQTRSLRNVNRDLNRVVRAVTATAPDITVNARLDGDADRDLIDLDGIIRRVGRTAATGARSFAGLGASVGALGIAAGAAIPLLAGIAAAAVEIAPAAAVGTSALLTMQLATNTLKIAMVGVEDAIKAAFETGEGSAEEFEKALAKLAPEAQDFVKEIRGMRDELTKVQQRVQQNFFRGFDDALRNLAQSAAPAVTRALDGTSKSLNRMALGAADAATKLAKDGTLGRALDSAVESLQNLERAPGQATTAFGQLAAASGPSMERVSKAVARAADGIARDLTRAFETGRLKIAIEEAIDAVAQLGRIGGLILEGLGNVIAGVTQNGRGLFDQLEQMAGAFERLTASKEFQTILSELAKTSDALVKNVLPLLQEAFVQLAPVIKELGPPVRDFINQVGPELIPVIKELGVILLDLAIIAREQMPLAIEFTKAALQVLTIALRAVHFVLEKLIIPVVTFVAGLFDKYGLVISRVSGSVARDIGDLARKFEDFRSRVASVVQRGVDLLALFAVKAASMAIAVFQAVQSVIRIFTDLPHQIASALSGLGNTMFRIGQNIMLGLIDGLVSLLGRVRGIANEIAATVAGAVTSFLGISSPSKLFREYGENTVQGFINGIRALLPELATASVTMGTTVSTGAGVGTPGFSFAVPGAPAPIVQVQIGNQVIDDHVRVITRAENQIRDRRLSQGVRR